jgi:hypothetical protein
VKVWGRRNVSASVHEDTKWYCISVGHVIFIVTIYYYYLNYLRLINGIYICIVLGIVFVL